MPSREVVCGTKPYKDGELVKGIKSEKNNDDTAQKDQMKKTLFS